MKKERRIKLRKIRFKGQKNTERKPCEGKEFFLNKITMLTVAVIAAIAPWIFYCCRVGHVYVDIIIFDGFCLAVFFIMIVNAAAAVVLALLRIKEKISLGNDGKKEKICYIAEIIVFSLTVLFTASWVACLGVMCAESAPVAGRMAAKSLPVALLVYGILFFALFFPTVTNKKARTAIGTVCIIAGIIGLTAAIFPFSKYEFVSDPMVIDTGEGYSVVFATTDNGTGYIEYTYDGDTYKLFDEHGGRKVNARIHSFNVPYEHLEGNEYKVVSTRITDELSYGGRTGETIESKVYKFNRNKGEENKYLCISDWHTRLKEAYKATEHTDGYDGVILLGDAAPGLQYEEEAAEYIVKFGGDLTKGGKPVIYARGNHETRGKYASELGDALGLGDYYTDIKVGNRRFIVLDSAEDKEDSHPEYGGMADYSAYRERMVEWLEGLNAGENEEVIVICHDYEICREKELSERAIKALKNLGAKVILCGHYHEVGFGEKEGIPYYIDGGHTDNGFAVSTVEFRNGEILLNAVNGDGENVGSYKIS